MNVAYKFKNLITAHIDSLDPIPHNSFHIIDDDDATVVTSNRSLGTSDTSTCSRITLILDLPILDATIPYLASAARTPFDTSLHKRPGAITIASTRAQRQYSSWRAPMSKTRRLQYDLSQLICPMGDGSCRLMCVTSQYPC